MLKAPSVSPTWSSVGRPSPEGSHRARGDRSSSSSSSSASQSWVTRNGPILMTILKFLGLFAIVPVFFAMPYVVQYVAGAVKSKTYYFRFIWVFYFACFLVAMFTKKKHTWESFFTQFLTWALFALGSYSMIGVFNFLDAETKQVTILLWTTISFIFYLAYVYYDDVDHKELARLEEEKQKKEEERLKREDERLKKLKLERKQQQQQQQQQQQTSSQEPKKLK